jgi:hypothetical protein
MCKAPLRNDKDSSPGAPGRIGLGRPAMYVVTLINPYFIPPRIVD